MHLFVGMRPPTATLYHFFLSLPCRRLIFFFCYLAFFFLISLHVFVCRFWGIAASSSFLSLASC